MRYRLDLEANGDYKIRSANGYYYGRIDTTKYAEYLQLRDRVYRLNNQRGTLQDYVENYEVLQN